MRIIFLITILFATAPPASFSTAAQRCLTYEPTAVVLYGKLRRHRFAGPPNYESVAKGDVPEDVWVLHLSKSICVSASADWDKESNVSDIQVLFMEGQKQYDRYRPLLGRRVAVTGKLSRWQTGHHHTRVLLTVKQIKRA